MLVIGYFSFKHRMISNDIINNSKQKEFLSLFKKTTFYLKTCLRCFWELLWFLYQNASCWSSVNKGTSSVVCLGVFQKSWKIAILATCDLTCFWFPGFLKEFLKSTYILWILSCYCQENISLDFSWDVIFRV